MKDKKTQGTMADPKITNSKKGEIGEIQNKECKRMRTSVLSSKWDTDITFNPSKLRD